jgi:hypothetical protein
VKYYGIFDAPTPVQGQQQSGDTPDEKRQREVLRLAIEMNDSSQVFELVRLRDLDESTNLDEFTVANRLRAELGAQKITLLAVGRGAEFAVRVLAELAKLDADAIAAGRYRRGVANLILIVPKLDPDAFAAEGSSLRMSALASAVCDRIVVFHGTGCLPTPVCRETGMAGSLGHVGPARACLGNVLCVDISHLTLAHLPCVKAAMESLEVLGLVGRAVAGTGSTALAEFAKRMHCCPSKPAA